MRNNRNRSIAVSLALAFMAATAFAATPSLDKLRRLAAEQAKQTAGLSCRVRIQDKAGMMNGTLKIKEGKLMLDAERRSPKGITLGREQMIYDGREIYVLAVPRNKTIPNVVRMDIARINAAVEKLGDIQIARPDFCGNPLTALLDLSEAYDVDVVAEGTYGNRQLISIQAKRKSAVARKAMWGAAEKIQMHVDPNNGFAYYVGKFDKEGERVWEQFVSQIIPGANIPDKTFEYKPPAQASVHDYAKVLEDLVEQAPGDATQP